MQQFESPQGVAQPLSPRQAADRFPRKVLLMHPAGSDMLMPVCRFGREQTSIGHYSGLELPDGRLHPKRLPSSEFQLRPFLSRNVPSLLSPEVSLIVWKNGPLPQPRTIHEFPGKKILIVGDSHYGELLRQSLIYATQEPFDAIFVFNRYHAHWFREGQLAPVHWLPGIATEANWAPVTSSKVRRLVMIGHQNKSHARRRSLCAELQRRGYPLEIGQCDPGKLAAVYRRAQISLNISLNGDANFRMLEVTAAGGFLLADRLSEMAGVQLYYDEGFHYAAYGDLDDLCNKLDYFLSNPAEALAIATRGQNRFTKLLNRESTLSRFWSAVDTSKTDDLFNFSSEPRHRRESFRSFGDLLNNLTIYLELQELQRTREYADVLLLPGTPRRLAMDCVDLHRLTFWTLDDDHETAAEVEAVTNLSPLRRVAAETASTRSWDAVVGPAATAQEFRADVTIFSDVNGAAGIQRTEKRIAQDLGFGVFRMHASEAP
ncbi:MAG: glycosyltransferase [Rhodospirillaceae bacterium]|nr:glycosyltransferase [Rhodospirillaceae bacterium]